MSLPLMPKATAVWLIENTTLTFEQIAKFCGMHELEIKGIADGEVAQGIVGVNPIVSLQLTTENIEKCQKDAKASLVLNIPRGALNVKKTKTRAKYTPIARRQDKPDAILWLVKNYPVITNNQVKKIVGTTNAMIESIRNKDHWNMTNIRPRDPVLLGICSQSELNRLVLDLDKQNQEK